MMDLYIQKEIWGREGRHVQVVQKRGDTSELYMEKLVDNYDDMFVATVKRLCIKTYTAETFYSYS